MSFLRAFTFGIVCGLIVQSGWGQEARGTILGRVTDSTGAVVSNAIVEISNLSTGITTKVTTNESGYYQAPFLLLANYRITAESSGFKRSVREGIELRVNDRLELDFVLAIGDITDTVTVSAETPLLDTASASVGTVVDARRVAELPIAHGEPYALMAITSGAAFAGDPALDRPFEPSHVANYAMGGSRGLKSDLTLDGAPNAASTGNAGETAASYVPPTDILAEMKVQTAAFDASVGQTQGGTVSLSLKSGTNQFHGTGYWVKLSPELFANNFFANRAGQAKADFVYNRWGTSATGPVVIPKLYNGHNRTFYTYGYEGIIETRPRGGVLTVPTEAERNGDFSALLKLGSQYQIYDPATRRSVGNGRFQQDPFPNNIIPQDRISPIAKNILKYYGLPNVPGTADFQNNLQLPNLPENANYYTHTWRLDHNLSDKHRIFGRANWYNRKSDYSDYFNNASTGELFWFHSIGAQFDDVYTITPTFIMNLRYGYNRFIRQIDRNAASQGFDLTSLGLPASLNAATPAEDRRFPYINISGYYGTNGSVLWRPQDTHQYVAAFDKVQGSHGMKFGVEYRIYRKNQINPDVSTTGQLAFSDTYTKGPLDNSPSAPIGGGLASFLLGIPTGGGVDRRSSFADQSTAWGFYFQDDWKVNRRLTITLGLRYEVESPLTERYNRSVRGFDPAASLAITTAAQGAYAKSPIAEVPANQFRVNGGLLFAGVNGQPTQLWDRDTNNFMPRVGLTYGLGDKTVIRAGFGIFFDPLGVRRGDVIPTGFSNTTNLVPTLDNGLTFTATLANPFPTGIQEAFGASQGVNTFAGQSISFFNTGLVTPYMQRWQLGIQRELPGRIVVEGTYLGNKGVKLEVSRNLNATPLQYLSTKPTRDQPVIDLLTANVTNPFSGLVPGTGRNATAVSRASLLVPYPQFGTVNTTNNQGYSWYHSLQLKADKRFSRGFTLSGNYTFSKFMEATSYLNEADPMPTRAISDQDFPHRITASGIYELPFGKGRHFFSRAPRGVNAIVSGWQVQGIYQWQVGQALGFGNALYYGDIKDILAPAGERTIDHWFNTSMFEKSTTKALANNVRTFPLRFSGVRGPGTNNTDLSAIKNSRIGEKVNVQFRGEFLNAFNHPTFANPNTTPTSTAFGTVTATRGYARRIQLGIKIIY